MISVRLERRSNRAVRGARLVGVALAVCWGFIASGRAADQEGPEAAYVVLGAQGAVARAVLRGAGECPAIELDGVRQPMRLRAPAEAGAQPRFPVRVCEAPVPVGARSASVAGQQLPLPRGQPETIAALGDTGCRIKLAAIPSHPGTTDPDEAEAGRFQDCNDPSRWPFRQIAAAAAAAKPDLVVHVGDYLYRESPCPGANSGCTGSPWGDDWPAWKADFFAPAAPLLAAAPWIMTRGNHETCKRAGRGYFRFLDPALAGEAPLSCIEQMPSYTATVGGQSFIMLDSSEAQDFAPTAAEIEHYASQFAGLQPAQGSWLVTHRPIWGVTSAPGGPGGQRRLLIVNQVLEKGLAAAGGSALAGIDLVISGHIHLWEAIAFADRRAPQFVFGSGGTELMPPVASALTGLEIDGTQVAFGQTRHSWGFSLFTRARFGGWNVTFFDPEGRPQASCTVDRREIGCREPSRL
jgi:predicted phosphodiesterase